jgi:hypothetical protein
MQRQALLNHFKRRLRRRTTWLITLGFTALFVIVKAMGFYQMEGNHPLLWVSGIFTPFLISFSYGFLSPLPWRYTGDELSRAGILRGLIQAATCNALLISLIVALDYSILSMAGIEGIRVGGDHTVHLKLREIWSLNMIVGVPMMSFIGAMIALGEHTEEEKASAESKLREAQGVLLRGQLSPHVLFNSLNAMAELVRRDPVKAEEALLDLSELYRALLTHGERTKASLGEERRLVQRYLAVEQLRLGDRLNLSWAWDEGINDLLVPPFLLQPLVENALKHGIAGNTRGGELRIEAREELHGLRIRVSNTGHATPLVLGTGIGLRNLEARLHLAYGAHAWFQLRTEAPWTVAEIRIQSPELWKEL